MWFNPIMVFLLRSPLHFLVSGNMMVLTYQGRKSGQSYSTPVSYLQDGQVLTTTSNRNRKWWRNLRGGAPVNVWLRGQELRGESRAIEDDREISTLMEVVLQKAPRLGGVYGIQLLSNGKPDPASLQQAAGRMVLVQTRLLK
jgi:deazaflavin-dependent oxidoreductase (nitroreductase family)